MPVPWIKEVHKDVENIEMIIHCVDIHRIKIAEGSDLCEEICRTKWVFINEKQVRN